VAEVTTDSEIDFAISPFMETFVGCIVAQSSDFTEYRASFCGKLYTPATLPYWKRILTGSAECSGN
jgi:hypothetical protein